MQTDKNKLEDFPCTDAAKKVCILTNGGRGIGSSIGKFLRIEIFTFILTKRNKFLTLICLVDPSFHSGAITCGTFPTPPTEAKMKEDEAEFQPVVMCPDEAVRYVCDAGGINVLKV